ncbi:MAG: hypothetical protein UX77_C0010G0036 [Parcubacteria group bacterium GW2011_GWA1_47_11]|uniref:DUF721 domain-containing protein n=1 Tax=Candidatus Yanofskybacteria bacterium RIFCSPHIGHO2_01_FULL_48_25b TaxID=1802672 RepID=A0A1F8F012_9BACT|nr:MAG: hypothetical protein UX77_C0010G0036 [Parcubacteria group bacterium GW2011_GWA1_47_11]OGN06443.1 MAG: hypothetical protein A2669_01610 [Candidatus Yanofskybacteria bacterium RIFCSPHIGHO2_01_FULL_48_25b]
MFRSIQTRIIKRAQGLKSTALAQKNLDSVIRSFLAEEFGEVGQRLPFTVKLENKKLYVATQSKAAANELVLRSAKLARKMADNNFTIEAISVT